MKISPTFSGLLRAGKYFMFAALAACTMTACSSDDDDDEGGSGAGNFTTPKYEDCAAKYVVNDDNSDYQSIELTASGNYIISYNETDNGPVAAPKAGTAKTVKIAGHEVKLPGMLTKAGMSDFATTRIYSEIAYGTYTKTGDDSYTLNGFGTVTVTRDAQGHPTSLTITRNGGTPEAVHVTQQNADLNSAMSNSLCRTWRITGYRTIQKINGETFMDLTDDTFIGLMKKMEDWAKKNDPEYAPSDWDYSEIEEDETFVEQVIFTKSGTYMVLYEGNRLAISTWKWENEKTGLLRYSWNPDNFYDEDESGEVTVFFQNNKLFLGSKETDNENGYKYEFGVYNVLSEVK